MDLAVMMQLVEFLKLVYEDLSTSPVCIGC